MLTRQKYFLAVETVSEVNLWDFKIRPPRIEQKRARHEINFLTDKFSRNHIHKFEEICKASRLSVNKTKTTLRWPGVSGNDVKVKIF